ncbi:MAG: hypothetical protein EBR82_46605 [Caulobacteraceae bacterium]|nr:hypothetical protein [Caulobacteraceae bacterium]
MPTTNSHYFSNEQPDVRLLHTNGHSIGVDFDGVRIWFANRAQAREALRQLHNQWTLMELNDLGAGVAS